MVRKRGEKKRKVKIKKNWVPQTSLLFDCAGSFRVNIHTGSGVSVGNQRVYK
jgi:hypothetical protein